jgi:hypothetical protein
MFCIISWYFEIGLATGVTTLEYFSIGVTWFGLLFRTPLLEALFAFEGFGGIFGADVGGFVFEIWVVGGCAVPGRT